MNDIYLLKLDKKIIFKSWYDILLEKEKRKKHWINQSAVSSVTKF